MGFMEYTNEVKFSTILLGANLSMADWDIGNGFLIRKVLVDDFREQHQVKNYKGDLLDPYRDHTHFHNNQEYLVVCESDIKVTDESRNICEDIFAESLKYISHFLYNLQVFTNGWVATCETFCEAKFTSKHHISDDNAFTQISDNTIRNIDTTVGRVSKPSLNFSAEKIDSFTNFCIQTKDAFLQCESAIANFVFACNVDEPILSIVLNITSLETLLLNSGGKKQPLAKRISVLLETEDDKITELYLKILGFYKIRSQYIHETEDTSTLDMRNELSEIAQRVIKEYLIRFSNALQSDGSLQFKGFKKKLIISLRGIVETKPLLFPDGDSEFVCENCGAPVYL